jgi:hypothetical protein
MWVGPPALQRRRGCGASPSRGIEVAEITLFLNLCSSIYDDSPEESSICNTAGLVGIANKPAVYQSRIQVKFYDWPVINPAIYINISFVRQNQQGLVLRVVTIGVRTLGRVIVTWSRWRAHAVRERVGGPSYKKLNT